MPSYVECKHLTRDELEYELSVRGSKNLIAFSTNALRTQLASALEDEPLGKLVGEAKNLDPSSEIKTCVEKTEFLRDTVRESSTIDTVRAYAEAKLSHIFNRLARVVTDDEHLLASLVNVRSQLFEIENTLTTVKDSSLTVFTADTPFDTSGPPRRRSTPVSQWKLRFNGNPRYSVNAFIERVEEFARSRNVTSEELFDSAVELFENEALIWYRAIKNSVHSWSDIVTRLRAEFEPPDYELELWKEIWGRTQGDRESVGIYFSCMINLFSRLRKPPSEEKKLQVIRRNISPYYIEHLALTNVDTVDGLLRLCKRLENSRRLVEKFQPPTPNSRNTLLEPDLAYARGSFSPGNNRDKFSKRDLGTQKGSSNNELRTIDNENSARVSEIVCWNCKKTGHKYFICRAPRQKFCYRCGDPSHFRGTCPKNGDGAAHAGTSRSEPAHH